jgi:hypothetical protein
MTTASSGTLICLLLELKIMVRKSSQRPQAYHRSFDFYQAYSTSKPAGFALYLGLLSQFVASQQPYLRLEPSI